MGAGHTVTVLYEVVPVGVETPDNARDGAAGRRSAAVSDAARRGRAPQPAQHATPRIAGEWLTVKARYKLPEGETSELIAQPVRAARRACSICRSRRRSRSSVCCCGRAPATRSDGTHSPSACARLQGPPSQTVEFAGFVELVEIARGLSRGQRR